MRATISIDEDIYNATLEMADPGMQEEDIFHEALKVFIRVQANKRLADLDGKMPLSADVCRRRSESDS